MLAAAAWGRGVVSCTNWCRILYKCIGMYRWCIRVFLRASACLLCVSALYRTCGFSGSRPKIRVRIRSASRLYRCWYKVDTIWKNDSVSGIFFDLYQWCILHVSAPNCHVSRTYGYKHDTSLIQARYNLIHYKYTSLKLDDTPSIFKLASSFLIQEDFRYSTIHGGYMSQKLHHLIHVWYTRCMTDTC